MVSCCECDYLVITSQLLKQYHSQKLWFLLTPLPTLFYIYYYSPFSPKWNVFCCLSSFYNERIITPHTQSIRSGSFSTLVGPELLEGWITSVPGDQFFEVKLSSLRTGEWERRSLCCSPAFQLPPIMRKCFEFFYFSELCRPLAIVLLMFFCIGQVVFLVNSSSK